MPKITETLSLVIMGVGCFIGGIYYSTLEFEEQVNEWDLNYQTISDKVDVFEGVSDPETIRHYVKELNKMLDDMNRLIILIDGGNELNTILVNYEKEYVGLQQEVSDVLNQDELAGQIDSLQHAVDSLWGGDEILVKEIDALEDKIGQASLGIDKKLNLIQSDLDTIRGLIKNIQDSKYGNKIWPEKK